VDLILTFTIIIFVFLEQNNTYRLSIINHMQTELTKIVQNSEESQVFLYEIKERSLKILCWVKIIESPLHRLQSFTPMHIGIYRKQKN